MKRIITVFIVWLFTSLIAAAVERPNVVFFLADDLGAADLSCYGASDIHTPRLNRLASEGVRFTQFYSNGPECTPTRTAFLTGRYQQRVGGMECAIGIGSVGRYDDAIRLAEQQELGLPTTESTISRLLKDSGYATAIVGKWHLGYQDKFAPSGHGFDHALYCLGGGMDYFHHVEDPPEYSPVLRLDGAAVKRPGYFTDLIADDAVNWLKQQAAQPIKKPFFLYVPFTAPHSPFQAPDEQQPEPLPAKSERWSQGKAPPRVYAAMIERMDQSVGKIVDTLQELGLAENTLVVFTSDNGGTTSARPSGLRGQKGTTFEGGIRVPCIVRWPGVMKGGSEYKYPAATFDLTKSIARAANVKPERPFDGVDILKYVVEDKPAERDLFWRQRRGAHTWRGMREGSLKFVVDTDGRKVEEDLFDLDNDGAEKNNLLSARENDAQRMRAKLAQWEVDVKPVR